MPLDEPQTDPSHGHVPVMVEEVIEVLHPHPGETIVDCTAGRGGHASRLAEHIAPGGTIVLFDLDTQNLEYAGTRVQDETGLEPILIRGSFVSIGRELTERGLCANGVLVDLGFASNQIDLPERGLSIKGDGPLDMRLDPSAPVKASDLLSSLDEPDLTSIIRRYGEDPAAARIARKIVATRSEEPIQTTAHLARIVVEAYGARARESRVHPATRTFQALRIAVNDEMSALEALLDEIQIAAQASTDRKSGWLAPGARLAGISFHSLEDRLLKQRFAEMDRLGLLKDRARSPRTPSTAEIRSNPRARSAKLRCATVGAPET